VSAFTLFCPVRGVHPEVSREILVAAHQTATRLSGRDDRCAALRVMPDLHLAHSGPVDALAWSDNHDRWSLLLQEGAYCHSGERLSSREALARRQARGLDFVPEVVPPFGMVLGDLAGSRIEVLTDHCALKHVYFAQLPEGTLVSSSASTIASVAERELDLESVAILSKVGHLLGEASLFHGVGKIPPRKFLEIESGVARVSPLPFDEAPVGTIEDENEAVESGAEVVRACLGSCLSAHPSAALQLSGGWDSRLALAAIPADQRREHIAVTVGSNEAADLAVARVLTQQQQMRHRVVDLTQARTLGAGEILALLRVGAMGVDGSVNPLAHAVLVWIDDQIGSLVRVSGENGELCRGFYYHGQRDVEQPSAREHSRLVNWQVCLNDRVDPSIFTRSFARHADEVASDAVSAGLDGARTGWLARTDRFYLRERMQHLKGPEISSPTVRRPMLMPFFDARFTDWATSLAPGLKRHNRVAARIIERLAPELLQVPLDTGLRPVLFARGGPAPGLVKRLGIARRLARKAWQILTASAQPAVGASTFLRRCTPLVREHDLLRRVRSLAFIDEQVLDTRIRDGRLDYATFGLLWNLECSLEALSEARPRSSSVVENSGG